MELDWAVWGPPLLVLAVSVVVGVWGASRIVAQGDAIARETRRIDLESTHDEVLDAIKQLDLDRDKLDPALWTREREELLARGAGALRALEEVPAAEIPAAPAARPTTGPPLMAPEWKGALYALAVVGVLFVLYNVMSGETVERRDGASMTGNQSLGGPEDPAAAFRASPMFQQREAELIARLQANPNDVDALNDLTLLYINAGDPQKAFQQNEVALKADAKNADTRTLRAVLTAMMGMSDKALGLLDQVLVDEPKHTMALMFRARLLMMMGRPDDAVKGLEAAVQANPSDLDLARFLADTRNEMSATSPPADGQRLAAGTLQIDPALAAKLTGGETLFLSVADPARPRPPLAADRKAGPFTFPLPFELTTAHIRAMPGANAQVPAVLDFKARLDGDGNAMTDEPGLPRVTVTGVPTGTGGLTVVLGLADAPVPAAAVGGNVDGNAGLLAPAAPPPAPGAILAAGVASLDPGRSITGNEVVFVSVLDPNGGPPLAVRRVPAKFPLSFQVTTDDVIPMMGDRPVPETVVVAIRVDDDGNATSKNGEPEVRQAGVKKGATDLQLTLK